MEPKMRALGVVFGMLLLVIFLGLSFLFQRFFSSDQSALENQCEKRMQDLMRELGIEVNQNCVVWTSPINPILNNLIQNINWQVFTNRQVLMIVTSDGVWIRYLGNVITSHHHLLKDNLHKRMLHIPQSEICQFRLENWQRDFQLQCLVTLKTTRKTYYFWVDDERGGGGDFSSENFHSLRCTRFAALLTEDESAVEIFRSKQEELE